MEVPCFHRILWIVYFGSTKCYSKSLTIKAPSSNQLELRILGIVAVGGPAPPCTLTYAVLWWPDYGLVPMRSRVIKNTLLIPSSWSSQCIVTQRFETHGTHWYDLCFKGGHSALRHPTPNATWTKFWQTGQYLKWPKTFTMPSLRDIQRTSSTKCLSFIMMTLKQTARSSALSVSKCAYERFVANMHPYSQSLHQALGASSPGLLKYAARNVAQSVANCMLTMCWTNPGHDRNRHLERLTRDTCLTSNFLPTIHSFM